MRLAVASAWFLSWCAAISLCAQISPPRESRIEGQVVADGTTAPLRRARVTLQPLEAGNAAITVETDERGNFTIRDISAGYYSLTARRDGYLESPTAFRETLRMPGQFLIGKGQKITGLTFHLRPWGVITGKVRYDDGEPAIGIRVDLYRQLHTRGRIEYRNVGAGLTNDRGEYRIHDLAPGDYYLAAVYERNIAQQQAEPDEQAPADAQGRELPVIGYTTTFYPGSLKLSEATPVHIETGREIGGIDLLLQQTRKVKLHGRITNGVAGGPINATLFLSRLDAFNNGALAAPVRATFDKNANFEIRNVAPGNYEMWAEATIEGQRLVARKVVTVSSDDVESLELIAAATRSWKGSIRVDGTQRLPPQYAPRVRMEPRSDRGQILDLAATDSTIAMALMPNELYDVFIPNLPEDFYISSIKAGGADVRAVGLAGSSAAEAPFEISLDGRGGRVGGRLFDAAGYPMSGASAALVPESTLLQDYRESSADEYGQFGIRGIAPGKYTLVAWLDEPPCDIYDPDALDACKAKGVALTVTPSSEQVNAFTIR